eukprot:510494_1
MSSSKICVSIWKALVNEQESRWNVKRLRNMGTYEIVDWVRSMRKEFDLVTDDFNIEILVQIIYDKELTGRQLQKDGIDQQTLQKWFVEWNDLQQGGAETVTTDNMEAVMEVFFDQLSKKKELQKQLLGIGPGEKKFDTKKLNDVVTNVRSQWKDIKSQIVENRLTVKTIQKYFSMLSNENESTIAKELTLMFGGKHSQSGGNIDMKGIAKNIVIVFECISALDSATSIRDATQLFHQLLTDSSNNKPKIREDDAWKQRLDLLKTDVTDN